MKLSRINRFLVGVMVVILLAGGLILWRKVTGLNNRAANHRLITAILHNDTTGVKEALKAGADPNAEMEGFDWTDFVLPLTKVLERNTDQHSRDTPLLLTMDSLVKRDAKAVDRKNDSIPLENLAMVKALVEAGADVNARNRIDNTPLNMAVGWGYYDTSHYLMEHRANPGIADSAGMTPLHFAASRGDTRSVKDLLDHGANPNVKDIGGMTPLFFAAMPPETPEQIETVKILLRYHADSTIKDKTGMTALAHARQDQRHGIVKLLQQNGAKIQLPSP